MRYISSFKSSRLLPIAFMFLALSGFAYNLQVMQDFMANRYGDDGSNILNAWIRMIDDNSNNGIDEKMLVVNDFFNRRINFTNDILLWGQEDFWATPLETMGVRAGDCEDYTIAKYMSLIELGIPPERLRLIYVKATIQRGSQTNVQAHMVLGYYSSPNAIPLILDNIDKSIKSANQRADLRPVYSFNRQGLWVGNISKSQADPTSRLSPWRDALQRMQQEGF